MSNSVTCKHRYHSSFGWMEKKLSWKEENGTFEWTSDGLGALKEEKWQHINI